MPKRNDINKVLVIGSGPIVIGQAAEFDYAGTQACLALKEEGCEVVLCNSNPATIMTDTKVADKVYMEPLTLEYVARIIRKERPDAILPGIGGQTGLNLAVQLEKKGILAECRTELLGTRSSSIEKAEDRKLFKELCESLGEPVLPSEIADSMESGLRAARDIGFPVVLRPAFTLGGTGGGFAQDEEEFLVLMKNALQMSPVHQVLIEKSVRGYKEIEYEVMRDKNDTAITVCNMENIDPVGIHTGDSIVVCPSQTLTNKEYHMLRDSALRVIRALEIEGGCNVQFALDPKSFQYYLIEVNPRVSRSSALASKASGYPIARVSAKIGIGFTLDEIMLANTPAAFEPSLDYVVTKMPRFPFDKYPKTPDSSAEGAKAENFPGIGMAQDIFPQEQAGSSSAQSRGAGEDKRLKEQARHLAEDAGDVLSTQMKATGEVMSVGRTLEESLLKAVRSLETGHLHLYAEKFDGIEEEVLLDYIREGREDRIFAVAELFRRVIRKKGDISLKKRETECGNVFLKEEEAETREELEKGAAAGSVEETGAVLKKDFGQAAMALAVFEPLVSQIHSRSGIDPIYLRKIRNIVLEEEKLREHPGDREVLWEAKRLGFSDAAAAKFWGMAEEEVFALRQAEGIVPVYKMIDTCASEFDSYVPYFYSTYEEENEAFPPEDGCLRGCRGDGSDAALCEALLCADLSEERNQSCEESEKSRKSGKSVPDTGEKAAGGGGKTGKTGKKKIVVLGSGPIRIGQGVEFDYSTVHAVQTIRKAGYEAIIINNNPETVSTDYTCSDKLYFEPLCVEDVMNVVAMEKPEGVIATLGGQTAVNLAGPLAARGVRIIGTGQEAIERAENRDAFEKLLEELDIPQPKGHAVTSIEAGVRAAREIGYPVLVRPSFVLGGRAMQIVGKEEELREYLAKAFAMEKQAGLQDGREGRSLEKQAVSEPKPQEKLRESREDQSLEKPAVSEPKPQEKLRGSGEDQSSEKPAVSEPKPQEKLRESREDQSLERKGADSRQGAEDLDEGVKPVLVDKYIRGKEVEVDAVCDGEQVFVPGIMELVERTGVHSGDSISVYPPYSLSAKVKRTILDYAYRLGLGIGIRGLFNIQFIVDSKEEVYIIEVNPRSSRTVPFLSKATGYSLADIATLVGLGISLREQGIAADRTGETGGGRLPFSAGKSDGYVPAATEPGGTVSDDGLAGTAVYPKEKERYYVKVPAFSFSKLLGMDAYLSPEMKSTGEAIGYDKKLHRAMYKAMIASGMRLRSYGTVVVSVADEDKLETIPLVRRFYEMGFNIEASSLTGEYLRAAGIRTRTLLKPSEGSEEILDSIRAGYVSYVINTRAVLSGVHYGDGVRIRSCASQNSVPMLTSLDTVRMLLDVLEEMTMGISTIDGM